MKDKRVNWLALAAIYAYVYVNPGCRQVDVARGVGLRPCSLYQRLPTMQDFGFLLYEDHDGLLYPFGIARGDRFVATGW